MSVVKYVFWFLALAVVVTAVFTFTAINKGDITIDLMFAEVATTVPMAFIVTFVLGWAFGLVTTGLWALRMLRERRTLKRSLRVSESEVSSLRSLPLSDAD